MAKFKAIAPTEVLKEVEYIENHAIDIFKGMTKAGAERAAENMRPRAVKAFRNGVGAKVNARLKVTKPYETRRGSIATGARYYGYIPKKDGKPFKIKGYSYNQGVPVPLLVALADEGRSIASTMVPQFRRYWNGIKYPITRPAFADTAGITNVMLKAQKELSKGILE